ncbi:energy transducer TonB [uncultured Deefgea sp.]|uniref:energy transducer TonB n=1 Tax=uncultured Deefgea sp. TaxID=1304914 RepID=UPI002609AF21|nr:energy transducer TonB [uncultured Deefgea sp.]
MIWRTAFFGSLLLHALVIFAWQGRFEPEVGASNQPLFVVLQAPAALHPALTKHRAPKHSSASDLPLPSKPEQPREPPPRRDVAAPLAVPVNSAVSQTALQSPHAAEVDSALSSPAVSAATTDFAVQYRAAYLNNPEPEMPRLSRIKMESGKVQLQVRVSAAGEPMDVKVLTSSHYPRLDAAALNTVKTQWRFIPAQKNGVAIEANVVFAIEFNLK